MVIFGETYVLKNIQEGNYIKILIYYGLRYQLVKMNIIMVTLLLIVLVIAFISFLFYSSYAELYKDPTGKMITEEEYMERHNYCMDMKKDGTIPQNINCETWVLTAEGHDEILLDKGKKEIEKIRNNPHQITDLEQLKKELEKIMNR